MHILKCKNCKKEVEVSSQSRSVLCSEECRNEYDFKKLLEFSSKNHGEGFDDEDFVYCRICKIRKKKLNSHINAEHVKKGLVKKIDSVEEYLQLYPDAPLEVKRRAMSEVTKNKMVESAKKSWDGRRSDQFEHRQNRKNNFRKCHICGFYNEVEAMGFGKFVCADCKKKRKDVEFKKKSKMKDFVECPLCFFETGNKILSRVEFISAKHLEKHNYTTEKFKQEFPDFRMKTEKLCNEHSAKLSRERHFNYGKKLDQKIAQKARETIQKNKKTCAICEKKYSNENENGFCPRCSHREYGAYDDENKVHCKICNFRVTTLSPHLLNEHGLTSKQYIEMFPGSSITSKKFKRHIKESRHKYLKNLDPELRLSTKSFFSIWGPNWLEQRNIKRKMHNRCERCRKPDDGNKKFHVHHVIPRVFFQGDWKEANKIENLKYLCPSCHMIEETKVWRSIFDNEGSTFDSENRYFCYKGMKVVQPLYKTALKDHLNGLTKVYEDTDEYIYCRECNHSFQEITHTHLRTHFMTPQDYISKYPGAPQCCKKRLLTKSNNVNFLTKYEIKCKWNIVKLKKAKHTDEYNKICCRLCDFESDNLVGHITRLHRVSIDDYLTFFKDAPIRAKSLNR